MSGKKILLAVLVCVLLFVLVAAGVAWSMTHYVIVDMKFYSRTAQELDLRQESLSLRQYEKLHSALPGCDIHWNVPFQERSYPEDATRIEISSLKESDLEAVSYLKKLKTVDARGCTDYALLKQLQEENPDVNVEYTVTFSDGTVCDQNTEDITVRTVTEEDAQLLHYLPDLKQVTVVSGGSLDNMAAFCGTAHNLGLELGVRIGGQVYSDDVETLTLDGLTQEDAELLQLLGMLKEVHLTNPKLTAESLSSMQEAYPHVKLTWEVELFGQVYRNDTEEVDLSAVEITDLSQVEEALEILPGVKKVILGLCGTNDDPSWGNSKAKDIAVCPISNEDLAAYRDRVREQYKVVWTVRVGPHIALRTDVDNFMPGHFNIGRLFTDESYNLRYCEDMVTLDIGHMTLQNIDFVAFMPKLRHLILAWTEVQYIEPIRNCKELVFLELDNSVIRDYSPLVDCTALEDLNIGNTHRKIDPILEMTWLKNLYMVGCSGANVTKAAEALTDTNVVTGGIITVGNGWRKLQNYYDMRDNLGVPYMN